ncbi:MAG TPA: hypothetical protein VJP84_07480 [Steroidobacteraceae bacterium]|jgi:hypothetical protein|nr:hypothetical protein [Steroidobacteraceae bacterium]
MTAAASSKSNTRPNARLLVPTAAVLLAAVAPAVHAEAGDPLSDRFNVQLGGFLLSTETTLRVDGEFERGTEIDSERDLGLKDSDRFRIDAYWRIAPKHKIRLMYFDTSNEADKTLERTIEFQDTEYLVGLDVHAKTETQVTELAYEYTFLKRDTYDLSGSFGIHNLKFQTSLGGELNGNPLPSLQNTAEANGPLPVLGLHGVWRFNDQFYIDAMVQYFSISFDQYDGSVTDLTASAVWQFSKHVGVGAGWNNFITKVDVDGGDFHGALRWKYGGARIFLTASF